MHSLKPYSLSHRLAAALLAAMLAVMGGAGWLGFEVAQHEADEIFDAQLAELAQTLLGLPVGQADAVAHGVTLAAHKYQQYLVFQLWRGNDSPLRSHNAPVERLTTRTGYSQRIYGGEHWNLFAAVDESTGLFVVTGQKAAVRRELAEELAWRLILPIGAGALLLAVLTWFLAARALRPVTAIARAVDLRTADHLAPVAPHEAVPRELLPLLRALNNLFQRVETAFENERRFTADAAHELRTPLAAMRLQAQIACATDDAAMRRAALASLRSDVDRSTHLIEQLLALARADASLRAPLRQPVDVAEEAVQAVAGLMPEACAKRQQIAVETLAPLVVDGDAGLVRTLIHNLVANAVKYCPDGADITLQVRNDGLDVIDNGPGIPAAERDAAMRRFVRLHAGDEPGSGLGFSIAQRIAESLGGSIELEEAPGGGLRAGFRLRSRG